MKRFFLALCFFCTVLSIQSQEEEANNKLQKFQTLSDTIIKKIFSVNHDGTEVLLDSLQHFIVLEKQDSLIARINHLYGSHFYSISDYENAMPKWIEAAKGYELIGDSLGSSKVYNNISLILNTTKDYKNSLKLKLKALSLCPEEIDLKWNTTLLLNLGSTYGHLQKIDSSLLYLSQGYLKAKKTNDKYALGIYHNLMSENFLKVKDYEKVLKYCDTVQNFYSNDVARPIYENSIYYSSVALYHMGYYKKSLQKAKKSLKLLLESEMVINAAETYNHISAIHNKMGNYEKSLDAFKKAKVFEDSIFGMEKQKVVLELEKKYETEKKEKENLALKQESFGKDLTIARKNNYILFGSLVFSALLASLIFIQLRKTKRKNTALQESIEYREKAEKELETVRDNISKDFHDDLGNRLARITSLSDLILTTSNHRDKQNVLSAIQNIKEDSDILYDGTRDFMFSLKSKSDYIEELFTYLSDFGEDFFESFHIDFYTTKDIEENIRLPYYWNRQLIMIFKEAMTNTMKHSEAKSAHLSVVCKNKTLHICFTDDGKGFLEEDIIKKNGLEHMKTRAEKIGGTLKIRSKGKETRIAFEGRLPN